MVVFLPSKVTTTLAIWRDHVQAQTFASASPDTQSLGQNTGKIRAHLIIELISKLDPLNDKRPISLPDAVSE